MYLPNILVVSGGMEVETAQIELLALAGFNFLRVDSGRMAIASASDCPYDAFVINDFLTDMDAGDLCQKLRLLQPSAAIVVQCDVRKLEKFEGSVESALVFPASGVELENVLFGSIMRRKLQCLQAETASTNQTNLNDRYNATPASGS